MIIHYKFTCKNVLLGFQNFKIGDSFSCPTLLECINYTPWRWPIKGWNMLEWRMVLVKWWF